MVSRKSVVVSTGNATATWRHVRESLSPRNERMLFNHRWRLSKSNDNRTVAIEPGSRSG